MFEQQPMKMASAESLCHTETGSDFSILTVGTHNNCDSVTHALKVPGAHRRSWPTASSTRRRRGVTEICRSSYEETYGPGNYRAEPVRHLLVVPRHDRPRPPGRRCSLVVGSVGDPRRPGTGPEVVRLAVVAAIPTPFLANSAGWVFTEMGRQPWVVAPNPTGVDMIRLTVDQGVSDHAAGDRLGLADHVHAALRGAGASSGSR